MRKPLILFVPVLLAFITTGCYVTGSVSTTIQSVPVKSFRTLPRAMVIANAVDVKKSDFKENKQLLFTELINRTLKAVSDQISGTGNIPAYYMEGLRVPALSDTAAQKLIDSGGATHAIIITGFNITFDQTDVTTSVEDGIKTKMADYDVVADVKYALYDRAGLQFDTLVTTRKFYESRQVLSGLLAKGPTNLNGPEEAGAVLLENVGNYARCFFARKENRERSILTTKEFAGIYRFIKLKDYDRALTVAQKLSESRDKEIASKALYHCAVIEELRGQFDKVRPLLLQSLSKYKYYNSDDMLKDYPAR